jgi:hypothetical protein
MVFNSSCTTGIIEDNFGGAINFYPNPAVNEIFADVLLEQDQDGIIEIENIFGQSAGNYILAAGENHLVISTADLAPGIYFCRTSVNGEFRNTEKIIIQH